MFGDGCTPGCHYFCEGCLRTWSETENTCPVCKAEFPGLHRVAEETGVPFYVISREPRDTREVVLEYMKAYPRFIPLLASDRDRPHEVAARFKVLGQPWTFVVDREGKVVALFAGRAGREALLDALLLAGADLP